MLAYNFSELVIGKLIHMDSHVFTIKSNPFQLELIASNLELIQLQYTPVH